MADRPHTPEQPEPEPLEEVEDEHASELDTYPELVARSVFNEQMAWLKERIGDTNFVMGVVVVVIAMGFFALLGVVATVVVDSFHFNSATYTEYTKKLDVTNEQQKANKELLQLISDQQKLILQQQKALEATKSAE